jgi:hypothetical protein
VRQKASSNNGRLQECGYSCLEVSKVSLLVEAVNKHTILAYFKHSATPSSLIKRSADRVY